jgi:hypothetical protein
VDRRRGDDVAAISLDVQVGTKASARCNRAIGRIGIGEVSTVGGLRFCSRRIATTKDLDKRRAASRLVMVEDHKPTHCPCSYSDICRRVLGPPLTNRGKVCRGIEVSAATLSLRDQRHFFLRAEQKNGNACLPVFKGFLPEWRKFIWGFPVPKPRSYLSSVGSSLPRAIRFAPGGVFYIR